MRGGRRKVPLLQQYREQLIDHKWELAVVYEDLTALDLDDGDNLIVLHAKLEKLLFSCSLHIKELLSSDPATMPTATNKGVKLPKLNVSTFDGDVLHWKQFWEQFKVSVHDHSDLFEAEKVVYLQ